jgi:hypothetical protein
MAHGEFSGGPAAGRKKNEFFPTGSEPAERPVKPQTKKNEQVFADHRDALPSGIRRHFSARVGAAITALCRRPTVLPGQRPRSSFFASFPVRLGSLAV